jgi:Fe-S-cluster-containing dehydrogenase component
MCFDRTRTGKKPMCATVCPSGAIFYGTPDELRERRPRSRAIDVFRFGAQEVRTRVHVLVPEGVEALVVDFPDAEGAAPGPAGPGEGAEFL